MIRRQDEVVGRLLLIPSSKTVGQAQRVRPQASAGERWASHEPRRGKLDRRPNTADSKFNDPHQA